MGLKERKSLLISGALFFAASFHFRSRKKKKKKKKKSRSSPRTRSFSLPTRTDAKRCRKATVRGPPPRVGFSTSRAAEARVAISEARDETSGLIIARNTRSNGESLCGDYLRRQAGRGGWRPREKGKPVESGEGWRARFRKRVRGRKAYRVGKYVARGTDA